MPYFTIAFVPIIMIYVMIQRYYIPTARELQRIESITRSPIFANFGEAVAGVATIRAYGKQRHFTSISDSKIRTNCNAFVTQKLATSWLSMRLDVIGLITITLTGLRESEDPSPLLSPFCDRQPCVPPSLFPAVSVNGNINPGLAGLVLLYALQVTTYLKHGTNMASKSESDFNSVERVVQYLRPETEAAPDTDPAVAARMPPKWPSEGAISVERVDMRYRDNTPLVLKGVTFEVKGGEKVGICGRTGSGKSSMFLVFFRMVEPSAGRIVIDGMDISQLGLHHLRSSLSMIPQDPFMFSGTVRRNLDPFGEHTDLRLWEAIGSVGLRPAIEALPEKLEAPVVDGGSNFSQGQRQLICLARALLRNSRILMMDEATASVDMETDQLIQKTVREQFRDCTVLTIAHRLNTIMDVDRALVMEAGSVAEYDAPATLLEDGSSFFSRLVDQTGRNNSAHLRTIAVTMFNERAAALGLPLKRVPSQLLAGGSSRASSSSDLAGLLADTPAGSFTSGHQQDPSAAAHGMSRLGRIQPGYRRTEDGADDSTPEEEVPVGASVPLVAEQQPTPRAVDGAVLNRLLSVKDSPAMDLEPQVPAAVTAPAPARRGGLLASLDSLERPVPTVPLGPAAPRQPEAPAVPALPPTEQAGGFLTPARLQSIGRGLTEASAEEPSSPNSSARRSKFVAVPAEPHSPGPVSRSASPVARPKSPGPADGSVAAGSPGLDRLGYRQH